MYNVQHSKRTLASKVKASTTPTSTASVDLEHVPTHTSRLHTQLAQRSVLTQCSFLTRIHVGTLIGEASHSRPLVRLHRPPFYHILPYHTPDQISCTTNISTHFSHRTQCPQFIMLTTAAKLAAALALATCIAVSTAAPVSLSAKSEPIATAAEHFVGRARRNLAINMPYGVRGDAWGTRKCQRKKGGRVNKCKDTRVQQNCCATCGGCKDLYMGNALSTTEAPVTTTPTTTAAITTTTVAINYPASCRSLGMQEPTEAGCKAIAYVGRPQKAGQAGERFSTHVGNNDGESGCYDWSNHNIEYMIPLGHEMNQACKIKEDKGACYCQKAIAE